MRLFWLILFSVAFHFAFAQAPRLNALHERLKGHPQQDIVRISLLNELSMRILKMEPEKSIGYAEEALSLARRLGFQPGVASAQNNLATYHVMRGNDDVALGLALEALKTAEKEQLAESMANSYAIVGTIYHNQLAFDKAIHSLLIAQDLNKGIKNALIESKILNSLGSIARDQMKYDTAMAFYQEALAVIRDGNEDYRLAEVLNNIGVLSDRMGKRELAKEYYFKALAVSEKNENRKGQAWALSNIGHTLLSEKKYKEAKEYLLRALNLSKQVSERKAISQNYIFLMQLENELGNFDEAHQFMVSYYKMKDSLLNAEKSRQIAELEIRYETEKKDHAIQLLERDKRIQRFWSNLLLVALMLLAVLSIVIYRLQRYRDMKNRQILNLEIDNLISQHHELSRKYKNILTGGINDSTESNDQRILRKAIELVESNISDPLFGVERMGKELGMSRTNLHRKMKAITGFPPSELIRSIRLRRAASLLMSQADSVSQISFAVGFEDQSYFSKSFKKQFGMPPSEYCEAVGKRENVNTMPGQDRPDKKPSRFGEDQTKSLAQTAEELLRH